MGKIAQYMTAARLHEQKAQYWEAKGSGYALHQADRELAIADRCRAEADKESNTLEVRFCENWLKEARARDARYGKNESAYWEARLQAAKTKPHTPRVIALDDE